MEKTNWTGGDSEPAGGVPIGLLLGVFCTGLLTLPAVEYPADPQAWREEARALILHGRLAVAPEIAAGMGERGQFFVLNPRDGRWYCKYGILNSLLNTVPLSVEYAITGDLPPWTSPDRVPIVGAFFVLLAVAIAYLLYEVTGFYTASTPARVTFVLLAFYTTYLWNYLRATNSESTQLCLFTLLYLSFLRFKRRPEPLAARPRRDLYVAWLALGLLCLTRFSYLIFLPMLAGAFAVAAWRQGLPRAAWRSFAARALALPVVVIVAVQAGIHQLKFGSPLYSGYHQFPEPYDGHPVWVVLYDFFVSWQWSFFVNFPLLLLALVGARRFVTRHPGEAAFLLAWFLLTFALVERLPFYRGECAYGPRYFVFILPLLALPALYPLAWSYASPRRPRRAAFLTGLVLAAAFLVFMQVQVHRLPFFFKYEIHPDLQDIKSGPIYDYFTTTPFAKINWDHLRCQGHPEDLPYYAELQRILSPEALENWEANLRRQLSRSNLFWFSED
jgi:hypothetical protein